MHWEINFLFEIFLHVEENDHVEFLFKLLLCSDQHKSVNSCDQFVLSNNLVNKTSMKTMVNVRGLVTLTEILTIPSLTSLHFSALEFFSGSCQQHPFDIQRKI
jgi:hypothetical protein